MSYNATDTVNVHFARTSRNHARDFEVFSTCALRVFASFRIMVGCYARSELTNEVFSSIHMTIDNT